MSNTVGGFESSSNQNQHHHHQQQQHHENQIDGQSSTPLPLHRRLWAVTATIETKCLWDEFNELGTEMIVTKAGR